MHGEKAWVPRELVEGYTLEPAGTGEDEFQRLRQIHAEAMRGAIEPLLGWDDGVQDLIVQYLRSRWGQGDLKWIVETESGEICGCIDAHVTPESRVLINRFYLGKDWRGKGLGTAILARILEMADNEHRECYLSIVKNSRPGAFYERAGFRRTGSDEIQEYFERPASPRA